MKKPDYLLLVNADHRLPEDFEDTIELITAQNAAGGKYKIEKKTYEAFLRLQEDLLKEEGLQTDIISVYRTIEQQVRTFENYREKHGLDYANKYVAKPGHSEHHTGFAIDVGIVLEGKFYRSIEELLSVDHLFQIIHKKLPQYGFILRYPEGKRELTKVGYEPWHFRYIDNPEIAREITDRGITFEEYWEEKYGI